MVCALLGTLEIPFMDATWITFASTDATIATKMLHATMLDPGSSDVRYIK